MNLIQSTELLLTYKNIEVLQDLDSSTVYIRTQSERKFRQVTRYLFQEGYLEGSGIKIKAIL